MSNQVTRKQAEATLAAVKTQFASWIQGGSDEPVLQEPGMQCSGWAIVWDGGPYEWAYNALGEDAVDEEMYEMLADEGLSEEAAHAGARLRNVPVPAGVWVEPVNTVCLGVYKA